jgi:hypothetical protein
MGKNSSDNIPTTSEKLVPTVHQRFLVLHLGSSNGYAVGLTHKQGIGHTYGQ